MLKIIKAKTPSYSDPSLNSEMDPSVESFLRLLKVYQSFSLSSEEKAQAIYAIAENKELGVYGGAVLYPQKVSNLSAKVGKVIATLLPTKQEVWCVRLHCCLDQDDHFMTHQKLDLKEALYQNLFKVMLEFGEREGQEFLVLTLCSDDYLYNSRIHSSWPYILEIKPSSSADGLFHGLLCVKKKEPVLEKNSFSDQSSETIIAANDQNYETVQ